MGGAGAVPPGVGPGQAQVRPGGQGVDAEPHAGEPLGQHGGPGGPGHAPAQSQHEGQVQDDVEQGRRPQEDQRPHRISHGPQQAGAVVVEEGAADAREDHQQVGGHEAAHLAGHLEQPEDGVQQQIDGEIQHQGGAAHQQEGEEDLPPHAGGISPAEGEGDRHAAAHGEPQQDGGEEGHEGVGGAHGGQGVGAHIPPHDEGVGDVVELLQKVAQHHGQGEAQQRGGDGPPGQ